MASLVSSQDSSSGTICFTGHLYNVFSTCSFTVWTISAASGNILTVLAKGRSRRGASHIFAITMVPQIAVDEDFHYRTLLDFFHAGTGNILPSIASGTAVRWLTTHNTGV